MARSTRTINPLHFEDLEPHRFEDLVRQLAYGFREWQSLEPTGRLGADEGIDIRGTESVRDEDYEVEAGPGEREEERLPPRVEERTWTIQCKREKVIIPKKVRTIVEAAVPERNPPYGLIVAAACDFSKKARDTFRAAAVDRGVQEFHLWGKADLEDMLYQAENDRLLFAYFGISLAVRKRSLRTRIRSVLAMKRKTAAILGAVDQEHFQTVLVRDAADTNYPYKDQIRDFEERPHWKFYTFIGHDPHGLKILLRQHFAYVADDENHWDFYEAVDNAAPPVWDNPWMTDDEREEHAEARRNIHAYWYEKIPEQNRATLRVIRLIPYEDIIDIDKIGDVYTRDSPHIFVEFRGPDGPFRPGWTMAYLEYGASHSRTRLDPEEATRVDFFPKQLPTGPNEDQEETKAQPTSGAENK